jgi:hypothetical protein
MSVSGEGGLDTGAIAADTDYYVYGILNGSGGLDVVASLATEDVGPTGFTSWRLIGAFFTDGGSQVDAVYDNYKDAGKPDFSRAGDDKVVVGDLTVGGSYNNLPIADNNTQGVIQFTSQGDVNAGGYQAQGYDYNGAAFNGEQEKYTFTVPLSDTSGDAVYMFSLNFRYNYSNSNGTVMTSVAHMRIKETNTGGTQLWARGTPQAVPFPWNDKFHVQNAAGFIKPGPGISQLFVSLGEQNLGGGAYAAQYGNYSISIQRVPF